MNGSAISLAKHLRARFHGLPFVFLLQEGRGDRVIEAFRTGARGIVYSNESLSQLADCISSCLSKGKCGCEESTSAFILDGLLKPERAGD